MGACTQYAKVRTPSPNDELDWALLLLVHPCRFVLLHVFAAVECILVCDSTVASILSYTFLPLWDGVHWIAVRGALNARLQDEVKFVLDCRQTCRDMRNIAFHDGLEPFILVPFEHVPIVDVHVVLQLV